MLTERQKKAVLLVAETFAQEAATSEMEYSDTFLADLDRRVSELENGSVKGYSWDEVRKRAKHKG
jgi:hypothetical protein